MVKDAVTNMQNSRF